MSKKEVRAARNELLSVQAYIREKREGYSDDGEGYSSSGQVIAALVSVEAELARRLECLAPLS